MRLSKRIWAACPLPHTVPWLFCSHPNSPCSASQWMWQIIPLRAKASDISPWWNRTEIEMLKQQACSKGILIKAIKLRYDINTGTVICLPFYCAVLLILCSVCHNCLKQKKKPCTIITSFVDKPVRQLLHNMTLHNNYTLNKSMLPDKRVWMCVHAYRPDCSICNLGYLNLSPWERSHSFKSAHLLLLDKYEIQAFK